MYKAFISYSHAADWDSAQALQLALETFAKPWNKVRNFNVFRDESDLTSSPHLWSNIQAALDKSEYFIYIASPASASSKWVIKEILHWLEKNPIDNLLIILTEGEIPWNNNENYFLNPDSNSLPSELESLFSEEPFYIDLREVKKQQNYSIENPAFKNQIIRLGATLHGMSPKDFAGAEVRTYRKMLLIRNSAILVLVGLLFLSMVFGIRANNETLRAEKQTRIAINEKNQKEAAQQNALKTQEAKLKGEALAKEREFKNSLDLILERKSKNAEKKQKEELNNSREYLKKHLVEIDNYNKEKQKFSKIIGTATIYFDLDKWNIRPDAAVDLSKVLDILNQNPNSYVFIESYSYQNPDLFEVNPGLDFFLSTSEKMKNSIIHWLVVNGTNSERLKGIGLGEYLNEMDPKKIYYTEAACQLFRKSEITICEKNN